MKIKLKGFSLLSKLWYSDILKDCSYLDELTLECIN